MSALPVEITVEAGDWPELSELERIVGAIVDQTLRLLEIRETGSELGVLFTDDDAIRRLNAEWRGQDKATNVLSFPAFSVSVGGPLPPMLGDIALAYGTVTKEAAQEGKPMMDHLSHLLAHGLLHLLGYDHVTEEEANAMEAIERRVLEKLAIPNPYR